MSSMIDTLAISKRLQRAGDSPEHADAVAEVFGMLLQENVVTKVDLRDACNVLDKKIDTVAANLGSDIRGLSERGESLAARYEGRLSRAMLTLFVGLTGVITLATSFLMAHIH